MAKKYGFGVVGLGMGRAHCRRLLQERRAKLVAVCDIDKARGRAAEEEFGVPWFRDYKDMLKCPGLEVVIVATPSGMHAPFAIQAAKAGKHVLCEKPIEVELSRARRIVQACRKAGVKLQVGFQNRCTRDSLRTRGDIETGRLGKLLFGEMIMHWWRSDNYFKQGRWRGTWKLDGGGAFMNQAVHYVDLLVWFMGKPVSVVGRAKTMLHPIETEDVGMAIVNFEGGAQAVLVATTTSYPIAEDHTVIHLQGTEGRVTLSGSYVLERTDVHLAKGGGRAPAARATTLYRDLMRAIDEDRDPICSGEEALKSLALIKAIYRSSRTCRQVRLR